jgi:hypothetical protein
LQPDVSISATLQKYLKKINNTKTAVRRRFGPVRSAPVKYPTGDGRFCAFASLFFQHEKEPAGA